MNLNLLISLRYLFGKKSTNAINYITWLSIIGIAIGTAALILILSVFNGFQSFISGMNSAFNPDLKVVPYEGKYFSLDDDKKLSISAIEGIAAFTETLEEVALFDYKETQKPGIIKGVDHNYQQVTGIDSTITRGKFALSQSGVSYGVVGRVMSVNLSINPADKLTPITVYMPIRKKTSLLNKLGKEFKSQELYPSGVFTVGGDIDGQYVLTSKSFVEDLLDVKGKLSSLEIKLTPDADESDVKNAIASIVGENIIIKNRYEQDASFLRIMNIEKWISFLIAAMVLLIIAFNLVGSLWMIVLEKKKDISILRSMGYTTGMIRSIYIWEGLLITFIGMICGLLIALLLYYLQKQYGLIGIPQGFLIDAYPVEIELRDFVVTILTVLSIGFLASLLPAIRAGQVTANVRNE